jgi:hypothetical protein
VAIESDLISIFGLIPGGSSATKKLGEFKELIRVEAKKGALEAVPDIEKTVRPYVYAAIAAGFGGFLLGLAAILRSRR